MNPKLILIVLVIAGLSSCSTAYKIEQTPDDVYYSPAPQQNVYVQTNNVEDRNVYNNSLPEDREIYRHMNSRRWRRHHRYDYDYPYGSGYYPYGNNYPVYVDPKTGNSPSTYNGARKYDLGTYTKPPVTTYTIDPKTGKIINVPNPSATTSNGTPARTFPKPGNGTAVGNLLRKVFSNPGSTYSNNNDNSSTQAKTYEPSKNSSTNNSSSSSSRSSSSSSSSGGSNAPVRTFNK